MILDNKPYRGARDFYPKEKQLQKYIFGVWRETVESYGYQEYDAPIIESLDLYLAKTSQEIVKDQTYIFEDRGGRKVTLRPEMTPTVSRMVATKRQELAYPLRWYSIPNLWRYERPQKGRLREHWQLNVDLFGIEGIEADHEVIMIADDIMQKFGAQRDMYTVRLNSRKLINFILSEYIGLDDSQTKDAIRLIDRMHKISHEEYKKELYGAIGDKAPALIEFSSSPTIEDLPVEVKNHPSCKELHKLEMMLARSNVTNAQFDITLMRGFDYYTDIVFEVFDTNPENKRSLFGGGRYDGLVGQFGVEPLPTVGFGLGDVTFCDFLTTHNLLPQISNLTDVDVILIGDVYLQAQDIIKILRKAGLKVAVDSGGKKMDKQIKSAVKAGFKYVIIIGENELTEDKFNLKDLETGQEVRLDIKAIIETLLPKNIE